MFVGHYGVSFAAKKSEDSIPLWVLFLAVQLLDVVWAPLVLLGVEKVRHGRHLIPVWPPFVKRQYAPRDGASGNLHRKAN